jgi:cation transport ATPase
MSDVSNGPGWWQASDGKWYPPEQQPGYQASSRPPSASSTQGSSGRASSAQSFNFDMKRWSQVERTSVVATLVLFISLFLPWYTADGGSLDGRWHGWMYIVFFLCLAIIGYFVMKASYSESRIKLPMPEERLLLIATSINAVLTILAFIFKPSGFGLINFGWGFGSFIGLIAALVAVAPTAVPAFKARRS